MSSFGTWLVIVVVSLTTNITLGAERVLNNRMVILNKIQINEELESNLLIRNMTDLIAQSVISKARPSLRLDSVKFRYDTNNLENYLVGSDIFIYDYFSIDLKKFRHFSINEPASNNQTTIVLLKTGPKKLDREHLCRARPTSQLKCSCDHECLINLDLIVSFINTSDESQENDEKITYYFTLPVEILDINDNRPFFYQSELMIDLDQFIEAQDDQSRVKVPLKQALDLDSTERYRIINYKLDSPSERVKLVFESNEDKKHLNLLVNLTGNFVERVQLIANDADYSVYQNITLRYTKYKPPTTTTPVQTSSSSYYEKQTVMTNEDFSFNLVSAINEIDIKNNNEISFRSNHQILSNESSSSDTMVTLAYLLVNSRSKKTPQFRQYLEQVDDSETNFNLFQINEMRNGLYSILMRRNHFNFILNNNYDEALLNYKITLDQHQIITVKLPTRVVKLLKMASFTKKPSDESTTSRTSSTMSLSSKLDPTTFTSSSLFNSVIVISTISIVVILVGLICFVVSLMIYFTNKCGRRSKKSGRRDDDDDEKNEKMNNILVYDMLPSDPNNSNKLNQGSMLYSSSSSNTSTTSNNTKSNNISPVTTTTTSTTLAAPSSTMTGGVEHSIQPQYTKLLMGPIKCNSASPGPLFDTSLLVNDWFLKTNQTSQISQIINSQSELSAANQLIKPFDMTDSSNLNSRCIAAPYPILQNHDTFTTTSSTSENNKTSENHETSENQQSSSADGDQLDSSLVIKYKSDLYKSSHIILKQQKQQAASSNYAHMMQLSNKYQARPVKLVESSNCSSSTSSSTTTENNYETGLEVASSSSNLPAAVSHKLLNSGNIIQNSIDFNDKHYSSNDSSIRSGTTTSRSNATNDNGIDFMASNGQISCV